MSKGRGSLCGWALSVGAVRMKRTRRPGGDGARRFGAMPLLVAVVLAVALALCVASVSFYVGWRYLLQPAYPGGRPSVTNMLDLLKVALAIAGGIGAVAALVVALRRQRLNEAEHYISIAADRREDRRAFNERFVAASNLLGTSNSAAVRMAGVYALAGLADDWVEGRQPCIDVLCGYLRLPYDPGSAPPGERGVRLAVLEAIRNRLLREAKDAWHSCSFDLRGVVFDGGSLDYACLIGGTVQLANAQFVGDGLSWRAGTFRDCRLFAGAIQLAGGDLTFDGSFFENVAVDFSRAVLSASALRFAHTRLRGGHLDFRGLVMSGGALCFDGSQITASAELSDRDHVNMMDFAEAQLAEGELTFIGTQFTYDRPVRRGERQSRQGKHDDWPVTLSFYRASFGGAEVSFRGTNFHDGTISFVSAIVEGSRILFSMAEFEDALLIFMCFKLSSGGLFFEHINWRLKAPTDDDGVPTYLTRLHNTDPADRHEISYHGLYLPAATLDFVDANLEAGEIAFNVLDANGGVISFNGMYLKNTSIRFREVSTRSLMI